MGLKKQKAQEGQKEIKLITMVVEEESEVPSVKWKTEKANLSRSIIEKFVVMATVSFSAISLIIAEYAAAFLE